MISEALLRTTVIGSYPQPEWLIDKSVLFAQYVPRVRTEKLWRVPLDERPAAILEATLQAIKDMEDAGVDVITDGEVGRESYSNHFAAALQGLDHENPARMVSRAGHEVQVPRVVGPIRHIKTVELESARFLRNNTRRLAKITLPGPFTLGQQAQDEHYGDARALALDFAAAINEEALALQSTGIDIIQLDEPWLRNDPEGARRYAVEALDRAFQGITCHKALHMCFGYAFLRPGQKPRGV